MNHPDRDFRPVSRDNHRNDKEIVSEMDTINHQHTYIQIGQVTG
jgi:hypothetical protein